MKDTIKKTYRDLFELTAKLNAAYVKESESKAQQKLVKIGERIKPYADDFQKEAESLRLDHASVDKDGNLVYNEDKTYKYTKEAVKKLDADIEKLMDSEFEFKVIKVINPEYLDQFGFLKGWLTGVDFKEKEEIEL